MTTWFNPDLTGGAIGANITATTEPSFSAVNNSPLPTYQYAADGTTRAMQSAAGFSFATLPLGSRATSGTGHFRIACDVYRVSMQSQVSAVSYIFTLRNGTTNVADVILRRNANATSRQIALRSNFTYLYQVGGIGNNGVGEMVDDGETWHVELEVSGTAISIYIWLPTNTTNTPDYSYSGTTGATWDNVTIGENSASGLTIRLSTLRGTDGEQVRNVGSSPATGSATGGVSATGLTAVGSAPGAAAGTLALVSNVYATDTTMKLVGKVDEAISARLELTPVGGGTMISSGEVTPDSADYVEMLVTGLSANTSYNWEVFVDSVSRKTGSAKTMPPATTPVSFDFEWGSCFDTMTSGVFALMAARNPLFFAMLGDWNYQYITGGANGNTSPTDIATVRSHREATLAQATPSAFFTGRSVSYTYSDCDGAGANADGTTGGHATGAVQAAYRQQFAHPTLPLTNSGARSWVIGRIRFIQTDETAAASVRDSTDNSSKTKLGAEQKTWFKAEIDAAVAAGQAVIWFGDGPWIEPTGVGSSTYNGWSKYNTERTELGTYIAASGVKIVRLHGDTHTLFFDNGTNNSWGGFPTASAAPIHTTGQTFGYTTSGGKWPTSTTNSSRQYGVGAVTDTAGVLTLNLKGYSSTTGAPTEVERFDGTVDLTPINQGTATGGVSAGGSAAGHKNARATASGAVVATTAATGHKIMHGAGGAVSANVTGNAVGHTPTVGESHGSATTAVLATPSASGSTTRRGTASATATASTAGVGRTVRRGTASATATATGAAVGSVPDLTPKHGSAAGAVLAGVGFAFGHGPPLYSIVVPEELYLVWETPALRLIPD